MNEISQHELLSHPLMRQAMTELQTKKSEAELDRNLAIGEAQRIRAEQGLELKSRVDTAIGKYEEGRKVLHQILGELFEANQAFEKLCGRSMGVLTESVFLEINLPTLRPTSYWHTGSTTLDAQRGYFSNGGHWKEL